MNDPHETERDRTRGRQGEEEYGRSTRARGSERREREGAGEQNGSLHFELTVHAQKDALIGLSNASTIGTLRQGAREHTMRYPKKFTRNSRTCIRRETQDT